MALDLTVTYPGQVDTGDAEYPHGKPRNENTPGSGDGFPLEAAWPKDIYGFLAALLGKAEIAPSEDPDSLTASQYLDAFRKITSRAVGWFQLQDEATDPEAAFKFRPVGNTPGHDDLFTLQSADTSIYADFGGESAIYLALLQGTFFSAGSANPTVISLELTSTLMAANAVGTRHSVSSLYPIAAHGMAVCAGLNVLPFQIYNRGSDIVTPGLPGGALACNLVLLKIGHPLIEW